jgi:hypothetical protein
MALPSMRVRTCRANASLVRNPGEATAYAGAPWHAPRGCLRLGRARLFSPPRGAPRRLDAASSWRAATRPRRSRAPPTARSSRSACRRRRFRAQPQGCCVRLGVAAVAARGSRWSCGSMRSRTSPCVTARRRPHCLDAGAHGLRAPHLARLVQRRHRAAAAGHHHGLRRCRSYLDDISGGEKGGFVEGLTLFEDMMNRTAESEMLLSFDKLQFLDPRCACSG